MSFADLKDRYLAWAREQVGADKVAALEFDELGYPGFDEIEREFKRVAESGLIGSLARVDRDALLYLIARTWDAGRMIAWLAKGPQLSNVCTLQAGDALLLAESASQAVGKEYDDARSQFASILSRISITDPSVHRLLLKFFESDAMYTKRVALMALAKLKHPRTEELVARLWNVGDEFAQITCLHVVEEHIEDEALLDRYLALAEMLPGSDLAQNRIDAMERRSVRPTKE